jgi:hypothetical protein
MSERKTGNGIPGKDSSRASGRGQPDRDHEADKDEFEAGTGYQPSTNQARDEPLPASHHDDGRRDPARPGEPARGYPSPGGQDDEEE